MQQPIFREKALERLSSPEQLDQVMQVTPLRAWLALVALTAVVVATIVWSMFARVPIEVNGQGLLMGQEGVRRLRAPTDGTVTQHRRGGDSVKKGDSIVRLQNAQGQAVDITTDNDGIVIETYVHPGEAVQAGNPVANVEPLGDQLQAVLFMSLNDAKTIEQGMPAHLSPSTVSPSQYGVLLGQVVYVSPFPASVLRLRTLLGADDLVQYVTRGGPVYEVAVQLNRDPNTPSGYQWSSGSGPPIRLSTGTMTTAQVVLGEQHPIGLILPVFN